MGISTYLANKLLDHSLGVFLYSIPTTYIALSTSDPVVGLNEPSGVAGYTRVALSGKFGLAMAKTSANTSMISFPQSTGSWGTVTHFAVCDASLPGTGNILWSGQLAEPKLIGNKDTFQFAISDLALGLT